VTPEQAFFFVVRAVHLAGISAGWPDIRVRDMILGAGLLLKQTLPEKEGEEILQLVQEFYNPEARKFLIEIWDSVVSGQDVVSGLLKKLGITVET
jgi:hypothetical protein